MSRMRFWPGETVRIEVVFTDVAGAPMAATGVSLSARSPSGAIVPGTALADPVRVGVFTADFVVSVAGQWAVRGTCSGPTAAAVEDEFAVAVSLVLGAVP